MCTTVHIVGYEEATSQNLARSATICVKFLGKRELNIIGFSIIHNANMSILLNIWGKDKKQIICVHRGMKKIHAKF